VGVHPDCNKKTRGPKKWGARQGHQKDKNLPVKEKIGRKKLPSENRSRGRTLKGTYHTLERSPAGEKRTFRKELGNRTGNPLSGRGHRDRAEF